MGTRHNPPSLQTARLYTTYLFEKGWDKILKTGENGPMTPTCFHTHTTYCDGNSTAREMVEVVIAGGLLRAQAFRKRESSQTFYDRNGTQLLKTR